MKISLKEVSKYVDLTGLTATEIADRLTFAGIEVEEVVPFSIGSNLIIAQIIKIEDHPDSDHLHICQVDLGKNYGVKQIVCGAPNARLGLKVICARDGAKLAHGVEIKPSTIRGVPSNGMLCSLLELGVDAKYLTEKQCKGIEELPEDAEVGNEQVLEYLGIDDTILDLKLLANRPDCNALINVARELSCLFNRQFYNYRFDLVKTNSDTKFEVESETPKCKKFCARVVENITVKESPVWMQKTLNSMGIRSINNLVDIGNYVMLITGQPLHIYDYDSLTEKKLVVKDNCSGTFVALDEKGYEISENDLCVTSNNEIECLAGVMGSLHSETTNNTRNIVIEAAIFDPKSVRLTSNRLGLASESSSRFVKGINKFNQEYAIELASSLIKEYALATKFSPIYIYKDGEFEHVVINCSYSYINNRLSTEYSNITIKDVLTSDFINVKDLDEDNFIASIPDYRIDINDKADLSEEVIRIKGFDDINVALPKMDITLGKIDEEKVKQQNIVNYLINQGYYQCVSYTLVDDKHNEFSSLLSKAQPIKLLNELTVEHQVLRTNLISSLLDITSYNLNRRSDDFKLFEISDIYGLNYKKSHIAIIQSGNEHYQGRLNAIPYDFYSLKGALEGILELFAIEPRRVQLVKVEDTNTLLHFGKSAYIKLDGKVIGYMGQIHPSKEKQLDFPKTHNVQIMELILEEITNCKTSKIKAKELPAILPITRDVSFVVDRSVEVGKVVQEIKKIDKIISDVEIFDIYIDDKLGENKKSLALSLVLLGNNATLKETEITPIIDKVKAMLVTKFGSELR